MRLYCPTKLPDFCQDWPCDICVAPGTNCCSVGGTVTAKFSEGQNCGCADDTADLVMNWEPAHNWYRGVGDFCSDPGHQLELKLICTVADSAGTSSCSDYKLVWRWLDGCGTSGEQAPDAGCTCDPALNLVFDRVISGVDNCCNNTGPGTTPNSAITITIS